MRLSLSSSFLILPNAASSARARLSLLGVTLATLLGADPLGCASSGQARDSEGATMGGAQGKVLLGPQLVLGGSGGGGTSVSGPFCGDGFPDPAHEECDDGNQVSGDGCTTTCQVEPDYTCTAFGGACQSTAAFGDGILNSNEECDDGNTLTGDGCSAQGRLEPGWQCPEVGLKCSPTCGDGLIAGTEPCDPPQVGAGCSAGCRLEPGYACQPGASCHKTVCGDGIKEGQEACDDTNTIDGDGCSALCTLEPECASGTCVSRCGDGIKLPPEDCDDGNSLSGDGCGTDCKLEPGWACQDTASQPPDRLTLRTSYRDFIRGGQNGGVRHPDFEVFGGNGTKQLVKASLDAEGKPDMEGRCSDEDRASFTNGALCPAGQQLTTRASFMQWYRDVPGVNVPVAGALVLLRQANGAYLFDSAKTGGFYPLDGAGWMSPSLNQETSPTSHNYAFTTEVRYYFQYRGGEILSFSGDDDVWVFVNRTLALDLGGLHNPLQGTISMDTQAPGLGLALGGLYEVVLFHAERHSTGTNFKLTLTGFVPTRSTCTSLCGDGILVGSEVCDDGKNDGTYGSCAQDCLSRGPHCGDNMVQVPQESCDDGRNSTRWSKTPGACGPGCQVPAFCGDGKLNGPEQCDLGTPKNTGEYGTCNPDCSLTSRCGDGLVQGPEECDGGPTGNGSCTATCRRRRVN